MGINYHILYYVLFIVLFLVFSALVIFVKSKIKKITFFILALISLSPFTVFLLYYFPEIHDARFRVYKRFYRDIELRMTRAEVNKLLAKHYPQEGERAFLKIIANEKKAYNFFMNPENEKEPNCEGVFLSMRNNKVIKKSYSRD